MWIICGKTNATEYIRELQHSLEMACKKGN